MRIFILPLILALVAMVALDYFIVRLLWKRNSRLCRGIAIADVALSLAVIVAVALAFISSPDDKAQVVDYMATRTRSLLAMFVVITPKALWSAFYGLGSIKRMRPGMRTACRWTGAAMAALSLVIYALGIFVTPYQCEVRKVQFCFASLPQAFDGYKIVQFSDAHLGSYNGDTAFVSQYVDEINALNPDAICFTGDLVSMTVDEAKPFFKILSRLHARDGVYTILGNHDYAMYMSMLSDKEKDDDVRELCNLQRSMGRVMLDNSSATIRRGNDSIAIVGTANFATKAPYPNYYNYDKASRGLNGVFKVHLQHNPQVWRNHLVGKDAPLTLSGHTHAMQCCINLFGWRWSPASFIYDEWGGAYQEGDQVLYVNTGIGMVGPPMRIGVKPEITLITLKKK